MERERGGGGRGEGEGESRDERRRSPETRSGPPVNSMLEPRRAMGYKSKRKREDTQDRGKKKDEVKKQRADYINRGEENAARRKQKERACRTKRSGLP